MFLICLSGTLAVFYPELERWEQSAAPEAVDYDPAVLDVAYANALENGLDVTHHMYVGLPHEQMPRLTVASEDAGWIADTNGALVEPTDHAWTHLLTDLHLYLHLPESFGMILVSALGALLCGLIVSGLLAHPRIVKDAFTLRLGGSRRLEQVDIHNRLSVWGAPFHLAIAVTGAFFGLALPIAAVLAQAFYAGDTDALLADIYGAEPEVSRQAGAPAIADAVTRTRELAPDATPLGVTIEYADEPEKRFIVVGARHPGRLSYQEEYRFDGAGRYIDSGEFVEGDSVGRQAIYSVYRLHFGHFGGFPVRIAYGVLGLALTVVSATGINIWLARRRTRDALNNLWTGFVWGAPAALALSAVTQVLIGVPSTPIFWGALAASLTLAQIVDDDARARGLLQLLAAASMLMLVAGHAARFGASAFGPAAVGVNSALAAGAVVLAALAWRQGGRRAARRAGRAREAPRTS